LAALIVLNTGFAPLKMSAVKMSTVLNIIERERGKSGAYTGATRRNIQSFIWQNILRYQ
jgi:hypothetical protein